MSGEGAGGHSDERSTERALAEANHWRAMAERQEQAFRALADRPLIRFVRRLDQGIAPRWERLVSGTAGLRALAGTTSMVLASLTSRPAMRGRRAAMARLDERLDPAQGGPSVAVISLAPVPVAPPGFADQVTVEVLAAGDADDPAARTAALHRGASGATAEVVCFALRPITGCGPDLLARLAGALGDGVVAATPTLVHPERAGWHRTEHDLLVRAEGYAIELDPAGAPVVVARSAGAAPDPGQPITEVDAAPLSLLVVNRAAYMAAGGLDPVEDEVAAAVDLCIRLRRQGGRIVHVPAAWAFDDMPVTSRGSLTRPTAPRSAGWRTVVERHGAALAHCAHPEWVDGPRRWVITTGAPSLRVAERWGDWHFAEGVARALRRLGEDVVVQPHDGADSLAARARDIHLVLHGLTSVRRTAGQRHLVWVISHPERFDEAEANAADLVLVASEQFAADLRRRTHTPVEVLLQATDPARFTPRPVDPRHRHPVTVVAKTRDVMRHGVADALDAGIRPAIYGSGWRQLVDPSLIVADHVDNDELPVVYSSADVVLNDHWDTMRAWGFVSNRIFDVLACGTPIVSDDVSGLRTLFGDAVPTYRTAAELGGLVQEAIDHPEEARARADRGRATVIAHHTFDHRAHALLDLLQRHGLGSSPS